MSLCSVCFEEIGNDHWICKEDFELAKAQLSHAQAELLKARDLAAGLDAKIIALQSDIAEAVKALEFYANVENWRRYKDGKRVYVHTDIPDSWAVMDYGKQAKHTLSFLRRHIR